MPPPARSAEEKLVFIIIRTFNSETVIPPPPPPPREKTWGRGYRLYMGVYFVEIIVLKRYTMLDNKVHLHAHSCCSRHGKGC